MERHFLRLGQWNDACMRDGNVVPLQQYVTDIMNKESHTTVGLNLRTGKAESSNSLAELSESGGKMFTDKRALQSSTPTNRTAMSLVENQPTFGSMDVKEDFHTMYSGSHDKKKSRTFKNIVFPEDCWYMCGRIEDCKSWKYTMCENPVDFCPYVAGACTVYFTNELVYKYNVEGNTLQDKYFVHGYRQCGLTDGVPFEEYNGRSALQKV